ncbi:MAG: DUF3482 domain-containing protein [Comamonadaceae bacterium]|nr:MAG: DUF3482 domain-containing protein [Comamonadaceae bacterium]
MSASARTDEALLRIAVVGHTNAGKTSLLRTLTRRAEFGEVSDLPGTTRHVEQVDLRLDGAPPIRFLDTPGLEDAVGLREHLDAFADRPAPPDRIRGFLGSPEAHGSFEQEAKVLRALLDADAAFLVIDVREPVLPKFRAEIELLNACGRPVLPVLNFVRHASERESEWRGLLTAHGLHAMARFDAAAPFVGAERELYQDLGTLLPGRREALRRIALSLAEEAATRRSAAARCIAGLLIEAAALRHDIAAPVMADPRQRLDAIGELERAVAAAAQRCKAQLLALHAFRAEDADEAAMPVIEGRWEQDLFDPQALKEAGVRLGKGAAVGAGIGVAADLALAGLSLGAGAALGGAIGGAVSQGFGPMGRKLAKRLRSVHELTVEDGVLLLLARWPLQLVRLLEQRGHAETSRLSPDDTAHAQVAQAAGLQGNTLHAPADLLRALRPARQRPDWATGPGPLRRASSDAQRETVTQEVARQLLLALDADGDGAAPPGPRPTGRARGLE